MKIEEDKGYRGCEVGRKWEKDAGDGDRDRVGTPGWCLCRPCWTFGLLDPLYKLYKYTPLCRQKSTHL